MPNPKRRHSRTRGRKRRTHWKLDVTTLVDCKNCGQKKMQHYICPGCGYYRGEEIIAVAS